MQASGVSRQAPEREPWRAENHSSKHFQPRARQREVNVNSVYPTSSSGARL